MLSVALLADVGERLQPVTPADGAGDNEFDASRAPSGRVTELWRDINASTDVSQRAAAKSAKVVKQAVSRRQLQRVLTLCVRGVASSSSKG